MEASPADKALTLDLSVWSRLTASDAGKAQKYMTLFTQSMEAALQQVDAACARKDLGELAAMGHRTKSTALGVGAMELADSCRALEASARAGDIVQSLATAHRLRPQFTDTCIALRAQAGL